MDVEMIRGDTQPLKFQIKDNEGNIASRKMLDACGVKYRKYEEKGKELVIKL